MPHRPQPKKLGVDQAPPSRRRWARALLLGAVLLIAVYLVTQLLGKPAPSFRTSADPAALETQLRDQALQRIAADDIFRADGQAYTVDLAQLAVYAARAGDRELFEPLRTLMLEKIVVPPDGLKTARGLDLEARDMAAWGFRQDQPLDASGTTETLRVAEALWEGLAAFEDHPEDRQRVHHLAQAYARHQGTDRGVWMIRNYYNFGTGTYSTNSFLIDYDPDLLARLAEAFDDADLSDVAQRSAELMDLARTPAGLLHQMIRPEVATIQPTHGGRGLYSLNGIEQLSNVLASAERCVATNRPIAQGVLDFCKQRQDALYSYYHFDTGQPASGRDTSHAALETWAVLLRLAVLLDDQPAHDWALAELLHDAQQREFSDPSSGLYLLGETLLALDASQRYMNPVNYRGE